MNNKKNVLMPAVFYGKRSGAFLLASSITAILSSHSLAAQINNPDDKLYEEAVLVVSPRVLARDRVDSINPVLTYDVEFFQRFEPTNLQEMLKRVPGLNVDSLFPSSINFTDTETLNFGFRGFFGEGAGQILINGRRIPGIDTFNAVAFSSIPAELVQEIQVIRSTSADIDAQGYGLTLNIILKDGSTIPDGKSGTLRANVRSTDGEGGGTVSGSFRTDIGAGFSLAASASVDDAARKSMLETETRFRNPLDGPDAEVQAFSLRNNTTVDQSQIGINLVLAKEFSTGGKFDVQTYLFDKDRDDDGEQVELSDASDISLQTNTEELKTWGVSTKAEIPFFADSLSHYALQVSFDESEFDYALGRTDDVFAIVDAQRLNRSELKLGAAVNFLNSPSVDFSVGVSAEFNELYVDSAFVLTDIDGDGFSEGRNEELDQKRVDAYMKYDLQVSSKVLLSLGYRYETTMNERSAEDVEALIAKDTENALPSAHLWWKVADNHDLRLSFSRNVQRPDEIFLLPGLYEVDSGFLTEDMNLGDENIFLAAGANVDDSKFTTLEVNYDYHFAQRRGIFGLAIFDKSSDDLPVRTGVFGEDAVRDYLSENQAYLLPLLDQQVADGFPVENLVVLENSNGSISVQGLEIDFSIPLEAIGLPNLSVSSNISYFERDRGDSTDSSTSSNLSIDHKLAAGFSYGISYNTKSDETIETRAVGAFGEERNVAIFERDPSLDVFIEKRFGDNLLVRLVAENLTDSAEQVRFNSRLQDQDQSFFSARDSITSDPSYQLVIRGAF